MNTRGHPLGWIERGAKVEHRRWVRGATLRVAAQGGRRVQAAVERIGINKPAFGLDLSHFQIQSTKVRSLETSSSFSLLARQSSFRIEGVGFEVQS